MTHLINLKKEKNSRLIIFDFGHIRILGSPESVSEQIAASERAKDSQLSETTRRKLQKRAQATAVNSYRPLNHMSIGFQSCCCFLLAMRQVLNAEIKSEFAKALAQLRHCAHHYKQTK